MSMENQTTETPEVETVAEPKATTPKPRARRKAVAKKKPSRKVSQRAPAKPVAKLVIFFRHGIAEDPSEEKADGDRSLTTSGHDRTKRSARGLARIVGKVDAIISSPLLRAIQTALWATKAYGGKVQVQTTDALLPDAEPEAVLKIIRETEGKRIVLVGHEPNLTRCMNELLGAQEMKVDLRRAGCAAVLVDSSGHGTLEWMLAPRMLRGL